MIIDKEFRPAGDSAGDSVATSGARDGLAVTRGPASPIPGARDGLAVTRGPASPIPGARDGLAVTRGPASPIEFRLDAASGVPTYLQLVHQVEHASRLGYLKPGDRLPKVRDVVASLAVNPNTVLKAYRELETKGLTVGRPGQGTFIQASLSQVTLPELTALRRSLSSWLTAADGAGLDEDGMVALFTSALRDFYERRVGARDRGDAASDDMEGVA